MGKQANSTIGLVKLAQILGISKTTVHAALTGSAPVNPQTRERVLAAAQTYGYRPNLMAKALRTKQTGLIGVIMQAAVNQLSEDFMSALDAGSALHGYRMLFASSFGDIVRERELINLFASIGVEGLVVYPIVDTSENFPLLTATNRHLPIVLYENPLPGFTVDAVAPDHFATGVLAAQHLLHQGRRRIAFLHPFAPHDRDRWVVERRRGCDHVLQEAGLPAAIPLGGVPCPDGDWYYGRYAEFILTAYLRDGEQLDAIFAANDALAYGAIAAIKASGLRVPEDIAIIGCDDAPTNATSDPPLTSMRPQMKTLGAEAVRLLMLRLGGEHAVLPPQQILLPSELVIRASCGSALREPSAEVLVK